jgi:vacuolar-type H+-ATPase subunit F/Vma7
MVAVGRADEVRGFALAGVETCACETTAEIDAAIRRLTSTGGDTDVGLIIAPASAAERRHGDPSAPLLVRLEPGGRP